MGRHSYTNFATTLTTCTSPHITTPPQPHYTHNTHYTHYTPYTHYTTLHSLPNYTHYLTTLTTLTTHICIHTYYTTCFVFFSLSRSFLNFFLFSVLAYNFFHFFSCSPGISQVCLCAQIECILRNTYIAVISCRGVL